MVQTSLRVIRSATTKWFMALVTITALSTGVRTCPAQDAGQATPWWLRAKPESIRR